MRSRVFRRVVLDDLLRDLGDEWRPAEREDGMRGFTRHSDGEAGLVEWRSDFYDELARSMARQDR